MGNEWRNTSKKALSVCFWNTNKEGKKQAFAKPLRHTQTPKKNRMAIAEQLIKNTIQ